MILHCWGMGIMGSAMAFAASVGGGKLCHVNRLEARSAFTCLERWWFYTLFFLLTFPKRGKVSILTYVFQAANKYYNELYGNHHHDHHHQETTRIYNAYTYPLSEPVTPCKLSRICGCCLWPEGAFGWCWIFRHCVAILACVFGAAGDRGTKQGSCNRGKQSWSWICKQFNSRIYTLR